MKNRLKVKMVLPALTEATNPNWRPIKYSLFPPLGLATLAGYFSLDDEIGIQDEHVEKLDLNDQPDLVVLQVYITSAYRAYQIADHYRKKGAYVVMGGLHVTSLPYESLKHADSVFIGSSDNSWREFIDDFRHGNPKKIYNTGIRSFNCIPDIRGDLIKRHLYLVPNSIVVSRGCPYNCSFCYKQAYYKGGKSFYTKHIDKALNEIEKLPGKHIFFLDDNILGDGRYAEMLFDGMKGMGKVWQGAASVSSLLKNNLLDKAVNAGLRSLFIGFESLNEENLKRYDKRHNNIFTYNQAVDRLHDHGVMINASFVFGMDDDDENVFRNTVNWALSMGIETTTFHILTPYPGTKLYADLLKQKRIISENWDLYDTRHSVFRPLKMTPLALENGYRQAYKDFYSWSSIFKSSLNHDSNINKIRHFAYSAGWKKFEGFWNMVIKLKKIQKMVPLLEKILSASNSGNGIEMMPPDVLSGNVQDNKYQKQKINI